MKRLILFEYNKIKSSPILYIFAFLPIAFVTFAHFDAIKEGINLKGYLMSTALITLTVLGQFFIILLGTFLYTNDSRWNTHQHMYLNLKSRQKVLNLKVLMILLSSVFITVLIVLYSFAISIFSGTSFSDLLPEKFILQMVYVLITLFFWGVLSLSLSIFSNSSVIGILIPFAISCFETLLYQHIGLVFAKALPLFNIKTLLFYAFDNLKSGSMIVVPNIGYRYGVFSHLYLFIALCILYTVSRIYVSKAEIPSWTAILIKQKKLIQ